MIDDQTAGAIPVTLNGVRPGRQTSVPPPIDILDTAVCCNN